VTAEFGLKWLLRFIAFTTVFALVAAVMPQPWLIYLIHKFDPAVPVGLFVTYVFRMLMGVFAFTGLFCFICSMDVRRYRPLIWILGVACLIGALAGLIALFLAVPPDQRIGFFWVAFVDLAEGLAQSVLLVVLLLLIRRRDLYRGHIAQEARG
jgi:hypothetical protein